jgi:oligopeptidase B
MSSAVLTGVALGAHEPLRFPTDLAYEGGMHWLLLLLAAAPTPPVAKKVPVRSELHGHVRVDDYAWLRKKGSKDVEAYLRAENAYTAEVMKPQKALEEKLYGEMVARVQQKDVSVPYREHGWLYYSREEEGLEHPILCRKPAGGGAEQVLLDLNKLRGKGAYVDLGQYQISLDGNLIAYTLDRSGFREYELFVDDLRTHKRLSDTAKLVSTVAWAADNHTLFYTTEDSAKRSDRVWRHPLGGKSTQVLQEPDEHFGVEVRLSADETQVLIVLGSATSNEVRALDAATPQGAFRMVLQRKPGREGDADHRANRFYIRVNDTGRNFRWVSVPDDDLDEAKWTEVIAARDDVMLDSFVLFKDFYVAFEHKNALPLLRVVDWKSGSSRTLEMPEPVYSVWPGSNAEFDSPSFRYDYTSFVTPFSVYEHDVKTQTTTLLKRQPVLGGYDPSAYVEERLWVAAPDGVKVPVSLVYKKGRAKDGTGAMLLEGYGSYASNLDVAFDSPQVSLLDRGVALAYAHVRGGGELGKRWHDAGRMMTKRNTFTDFIAVAEALVAQKIVAKDRLAITGASAGGLLMGAVTNMRPDLFKAVVAQVPFVDVLNTMSDNSLPLTVGELEEWGDPHNKEQYEYMASYSPYDNVEKKAYPAMLVTSAYNDSQVMYWEPAKWVAKLRVDKTDANPLLLKVDLEPAGHGGKSGRFERLHEEAFKDAFVLWQTGVSP